MLRPRLPCFVETRRRVPAPRGGCARIVLGFLERAYRVSAFVGAATVFGHRGDLLID
jgi:hypothetical protein